jgi:dihydroneopterin aldolase
MMDIVFINELKIDTVIGVYDWERQIRQTVVLDLEMATDIRAAASSDDIAHALNYKAVSDRLIEFIAASEFQLVETMAEQVTEIVRKEFGVPWLRLRVSKPGAVQGSREVGVIIERGERS